MRQYSYRPFLVLSTAIGLLVLLLEICSKVDAFTYSPWSKSGTQMRKGVMMHQRTLLVEACCTIATAVIFTAPFASMAISGDSPNSGATHFNNNCASCHVGGGNIINEKRTLQKAALEKFVGLDPQSVQSFVQGSMRHKMLVFPNVPGGKFTDADIAAVTSYIVDQASGEKW